MFKFLFMIPAVAAMSAADLAILNEAKANIATYPKWLQDDFTIDNLKKHHQVASVEVRQAPQSMPIFWAASKPVPKYGAAAGDGCLTPAQKDKLDKDCHTIGTILSGAVSALKVVDLFEKDPKIKKDIELAEQIIEAVNTELIANITRIVDEACGTCSQITQAVQDAVDTIEETIAKADPDWKNNAVFKAVVAAIQSILSLVASVCPSQQQTTMLGAAKIDPAQIAAIGKQIWSIVENNQPVVNATVDWAGAVPQGIDDWTKLSGWKDYISKEYEFIFKNAVGMTLTSFTWTFKFNYAGQYNGTGQYVQGLGASVSKVYAYLSEHVSVDCKAFNPLNYGTEASPSAGMDYQVTMTSHGYFEKTQVGCHILAKGDGEFKVVSCDQNM